MTPAHLAEIRARLDAATPGPWHVRDADVTHTVCMDDESDGIDPSDVRRFARNVCIDLSGRNATFIAHAPTDIRSLLAAAERTVLLDEVRRLAEPRGIVRVNPPIAGSMGEPWDVTLTTWDGDIGGVVGSGPTELEALRNAVAALGAP